MSIRHQGLIFTLPESYLLSLDNRVLSSIDVGPYDETAKIGSMNRRFGTRITGMSRIMTSLLAHNSGITTKQLQELLQGPPFVDRIIHRASLGSLAEETDIAADHVLVSMYNPGTSDRDGTTALAQAMEKLGLLVGQQKGFHAVQYLLRGEATPEQLRLIIDVLHTPALHTNLIIPGDRYRQGHRLPAPIVLISSEPKVQKYDLASMSDEELLALNKERRLAASLEELQQFKEMYRDDSFLAKRREHGLDHRATDVEIETWFGLRSEHCFHKEFNARITLEDQVDDPVFRRATEKGWLQKKADGTYTLEDGVFKTLIETPAKNIFEKLQKRGKNWIASMFEDNSGVVYYNEDFMFCIKFETHNSPSNKEPVQGAKTGIDGVNRDIVGTGLGTFELLSNFFWYATGDPQYQGWLPPGVIHPFDLLQGITRGVREGGNESQVPTLGGGLVTDPRYIAKCLVYCGSIGWSPVHGKDGKSLLEKTPQVGDIVFVAGQPVGIDGVHGATESSLSASGCISLGHVQADDPYTQANLFTYILDVARAETLSSLTDLGAMGLGSAAIESARATGGLRIDLKKRPTKYSGIQPWQIIASETQNNMLLIAHPENETEVLARAGLHEVQVTPLGTLNDTGYVHLTYGDETVALIDIKKLFDKNPRKEMRATNRNTFSRDSFQASKQFNSSYTPISLEESLCLVMAQPDVASKEWFFRQKDTIVGGATMQPPLMGLEQEVEADATMQKPLNTIGKDFGAIAYALGIAPKVADLDPYLAAQKSFIDMVGKIIALGGALPDMEHAKWDAWAVCGNYCQPNSDGTDTLSQESGEQNLAGLVREAIGVREAVEALNIPVISGKDSMKCSCTYQVADDFSLDDVPSDLREHIFLTEKDGEHGKEKWIEIHDPPTYLASAAVKIEDYRKCVTQSLKEEGDLIYVVGTTKAQLGASQFANAVGYAQQDKPLQGGNAPQTDLEEFVNVAHAIHSAIDAELVASCSYIHNGGLITTLAKAAIAGEKGVSISTKDLSDSTLSNEEVLYSETPGRFVVTITRKDRHAFEARMHGVAYKKVGIVTDKDLSIETKEGVLEEISLGKVKEAYQKPLRFNLNQGAA
ncbi:hypothetical protein J4410_05145 [Candidatus Woesearchaeota archaeon]|nr:hypothetical protein [Candidatus Woesearchaeota archaeon]